MKRAAAAVRQHPAWLAALFAPLAGLVMARHELWCDEWLFWEHARQSASLQELALRLGGIGQPHLWPAALWLLTRLTGHPAAMQALHLALATATVAVVAWRAPFSPAQKALFALGYFPFFEYAVISRGYALGLLCAMALCALFATPRWRYLAIGFALFVMAQSNGYAAVLACAFAVTFAVGRRPGDGKARAALGAGALAATGAIVATVQILAPSQWGWQPAARTSLDPHLVKQTLATVWRGLMPLPMPGTIHFWNSNVLQGYRSAEAALGVVFLAGGAWLLRRHRPAAVLWLTGAAGLLLLTYAQNPYPDNVGFARHYGHFFVLFVAACWLARAGGPVLTGLLAVHAAVGLFAAAMDVALPFSGSAQAAAAIQRRGLQDAPIVGDRDHPTKSVAACLERTFYYPATHQRGRRVWRRTVSRDDLQREVAYLAESGRDVLVVLNYPLRRKETFAAVESVERSIVASERYWIYLARQGSAPPSGELRGHHRPSARALEVTLQAAAWTNRHARSSVAGRTRTWCPSG